jgi:hypothetical protein
MFLHACVLATAGAGLVACASGSGSGRAAEWILADEAEKQRLESTGFPQYIGE